MHTLTATVRDTNTSLAKARTEGVLPAVVYGPKQEAIAISIPLRAFEKALQVAGESSVISLEGVTPSPLNVLIHELTVHPVKNTPTHVDFYAIAKGAKVEVHVPIVFVGEAPAIKGGASLVKVLHEIEIKADAMHLPHDIQVDISALVNVGDKIHVSDIIMPAGVEFITHGEEVIALAQEVVEEKEEAPAAVDMSAIEVEKKGKDEEAAEGAEEKK
jgi:large subunit ribosomal protein L25